MSSFISIAPYPVPGKGLRVRAFDISNKAPPECQTRIQMTLSSSTTKNTYSGGGAITVFADNFVFWMYIIYRDANIVEKVWARGAAI